LFLFLSLSVLILLLFLFLLFFTSLIVVIIIISVCFYFDHYHFIITILIIAFRFYFLSLPLLFILFLWFPHKLQERQLLLYGRVARQPNDDIMRQHTFCPGSVQPATNRYVRKLGRPRLDWASEVGRMASIVVGARRLVEKCVLSRDWNETVHTYYQQLRH